MIRLRSERPASVPAAVTFHLVMLAGPVAGCASEPAEQQVDQSLLELVAAEDARPTAGPELTLLTEATRSDRLFLRRSAVRALGRLESPDLVPHIVPLLTDAEPSVRRATANAVAQAFHTSDGADAIPILLEALGEEEDPVVRGTIARSLGRLALDAPVGRPVSELLVELTRDGDDDAPIATLLGATLGLEAVARRARNLDGAGIAERLVELTSYRAAGADPTSAARIRTLAYAALGQAGLMTPQLVTRALADADAPQAAPTALRFLSSLDAGDRPVLLDRALAGGSAQAMIEALRYLAGQPRSSVACARLMAAAAPPESGADAPPSAAAGLSHRGSRVIALDALGQPCPDRNRQWSVLTATADELNATDTWWQPAAHALVSLATLFEADAHARLSTFVSHPNGFVRAYAARAAGILADPTTLTELARDPDANVRSAAIDALFELEGHAVDSLVLEQLSNDDPQLIMTAAGLLEGAPDAESAADALLGTLERISEARRQTWRDARRALLERVAELGDERLRPRLTPFLSDYDPLVAEDVAAMLRAWTGEDHTAAPEPLARAALPELEELRMMEGASIELHMRSGGTIVIALDPLLAPTNTFRFFRLARDGYFDGLTFHRWSPNFVIQGGSPGANEYQGDGPFTRDEVGLTGHWRGTVGISTRGHDTGDGQIFVNLMDNVRLDHTYTIVGTVIDGMEVVDGVLEGSVIERAEVIDHP